MIGPESPENHVTQKYTNTIIGRYANRIPVGTHVLERRGIKNEFTAVANGGVTYSLINLICTNDLGLIAIENPRVSLHGGPQGFDATIWTLITPDMPAALFTPIELGHLSASSAHAIFRLISPDGDQGYPGKLIVEALIALVGAKEQERKSATPVDHTPHETPEYDVGSIVVVYRAKLDEGEKKLVTPINLTQVRVFSLNIQEVLINLEKHWGFNLDASMNDNSPTVKDHILTIKVGTYILLWCYMNLNFENRQADKFAELDPDSLCTGTFLKTTDYPSHMHVSKRIGERFPDKSYGMTTASRCLAKLISNVLSDDFYLFQKSASPTPSRIPLSSFDAQLDVIGGLLQPSNNQQTPDGKGVNRPEPVVELVSPKSGIKLAFDTNRVSL